MPKKNQKTVTNNQIIKIPQGSLIMMCAAPNSGKTHFSKKHFAHLDNVVLVCSDEFFLKNVQNATVLDTFETVMEKTSDEVMNIVTTAAAKHHTVVLDATSHMPEDRQKMIEQFRPYFQNIVLIVIDLEIPDLLSHGTKEQLSIMKRFKMHTPKLEETLFTALYVKTQFNNGEIFQGVNTVHRVTSATLNNCVVVIE